MSDRLNQLIRLHQAEPTDPFCTYGIALEHAKVKHHAEALAWLDKTLALDVHYCYAYFQKAKVYIERGEDAAAKSVLDTGMQAATQAGDDHARSEMAELLASLD
jgi:hypothetical protein